jgi:hypothetical protein
LLYHVVHHLELKKGQVLFAGVESHKVTHWFKTCLAYLELRSAASVCHALSLVDIGELGSPLYMCDVMSCMYCSIPADTSAEVIVLAVPHPMASQQAMPTEDRLLDLSVLYRVGMKEAAWGPSEFIDEYEVLKLNKNKKCV